MRIAYDNIIFGLQRAGGISVYWTELLRRADPTECLVVEAEGSATNVYWQPISQRFGTRVQSSLPIRIDRYLPVRSLPGGYDVFHSSYYRVALDGTPSVVTLYDFAYERFRGGLAKRAHSLQKRLAVHRARRIICISESARRDLLAFYGAGYDSRTSVVHLGVGSHFQPYADARAILTADGHDFLLAERPYLLFVGGRGQYKRFDAAVGAVALLPDYDLVIIGGEPWSDEDAALVSKWGVQDRVQILGTVPGPALPLWYSGAHALLYLSSHEGFGLPVLEAAMSGCPVIAQDTSSIPEVHGFPSLLLERLVADEIVARVARLEEAEFRQQVIAACSEHASAFTWDRCWRETHRIYQEL